MPVIIWWGGGGRVAAAFSHCAPQCPPQPTVANRCDCCSLQFFCHPAILCAAAAAAAHRNCAAGWPLPSLYPIAILLPAAPARCPTHAATAAHCCMHATSAAHCHTHAGCLPSIAIISPAAAACCRTHACCSLRHPRHRCCILLHARHFHHCFCLHCRLRCCLCHVY